jgi:histone deacetylase 1/2
MITNPAAGMDGGAPPTIPNPQYSAWHQQDQAILTAIVCSLAESVLGMMTMVSTSRKAWETLAYSFASQSTARVMAIRGELQKLKKLDKPALVFFNEIKVLADTLASIGQPLCPDEFSGVLCAGLDGEYDALVHMVLARALTYLMPIRKIYAQLLVTEQRPEACRAELATDVHMANVNYCARGGGFPPPPQFSPPPAYPKPSPPPSNNNNQHGQGTSAPRGGGGSSSGGSMPVCQICGKIGHVASCCFKRYDPNFVGSGNDGRYKDKQLAAFHTPTANNTNYGANPSYPIDPNWYADTAATDHFTNDLDKLTMKEHYQGKDQVHAANGQGMRITHIGHASIPSSSHTLHLRNILHVPKITRNLLSVKKFTYDNNAFFEFHPWYFLIKDQDSRRILLRGGCRGGLYNLDLSSIKQVFSGVKVSSKQWHSRLGHPANPLFNMCYIAMNFHLF